MLKFVALALVAAVVNGQLNSIGGGRRPGLDQPGEGEEGPYPPQPYEFQYTNTAEDGTITSRQEKSDGTTVTGYYGYKTSEGVYREVEYISDKDGYRVTSLNTNEPGVGRNEEIGDPADTGRWNIQPAPAGVVERWESQRQQQATFRSAPAPAPQAPQPQSAPLPQAQAQRAPQPFVLTRSQLSQQ
ncbi:Cuticle protein 10.9 [Halotydeus destructor]|nr:Cuticle protein 10.9 [Halotydeus destructor]